VSNEAIANKLHLLNYFFYLAKHKNMLLSADNKTVILNNKEEQAWKQMKSPEIQQQA